MVKKKWKFVTLKELGGNLSLAFCQKAIWDKVCSGGSLLQEEMLRKVLIYCCILWSATEAANTVGTCCQRCQSMLENLQITLQLRKEAPFSCSVSVMLSDDTHH